ncbi:uncharacterized protein LTR77_006215 [Saxophila tyrrhenica]|uniref:PXA domain-containing protein n=1 Tax=Saxophila tyrrhenica TaxID=1690608 RepID=A0AAV9P9D0_9PEZI|nr:hypothetical protein LTR77_006215 [Saxophila tyrrhenica]
MDETTLEQHGVPVEHEDGLPGEAVKEEPVSTGNGEDEDTKKGQQQDAAQTSNLSTTLQSLTDRALEFLAHASNETLGACLVGAGAATYMVLGRVGLVIIGVAGGVVLQATWQGVRADNGNEETRRAEQERRRETGVEVARRVLELTASRTEASSEAETKFFGSQQLDFSSFDLETASALNTFTDSVIKDYVYYWYRPQLPGEEGFPASCRRTLTAFILSLSGHLQRKRPADAFLDFVTNASSIIIVFLNELAAAINASPNSSPAEAVSTYLTLKPDSSLAYVLDEKAQDAKLALIAEDILQAYLDPKAYNCEPVHVFLKQVLAQLVLGSTVTLCSRPEWINEWIVYGLEESETTREVMNIVDAGVEGRANEQKAPKPTEQNSTPQEVMSKKEGETAATRPTEQHKRQASKAEEAMDEAMQEAKRLTQLMIEEDERRAREEGEKQMAVSSSEEVSEGTTTQGAPTPTSSQSEQDRHEDETSSLRSHSQPPSVAESPTTHDRQPFTSFDQLVPAGQPTALSDCSSENLAASARAPPPPLTLHKATISIFDDSQPGEKTSIKAKPTTDYLIQIEPSSSIYPGWMIARKYADFEALHEVLRRISVITGVVGFMETHGELPKWKVHTKSSLRAELERYLTGAVRFQPLAESEGMKRFLEKDQGLNKSPSSKGAFAWPTPDAFGRLGGDMMNVLTKAPKQVAGGGKAMFGGVAGGGKAVIGGVAGLVGGGGGKRQSQLDLTRTNTANSLDGHRSQPSLSTDGYASGSGSARMSQESLRAPPNTRPSMDRHLSTASTASADVRSLSGPSPLRSSVELPRPESASETSTPATPSSKAPPQLSSPAQDRIEDPAMHLPPPPSEMPEDYGSPRKPNPGRSSVETFRSSKSLDPQLSEPRESTDQPAPPMPPRPQAQPTKPAAKAKPPLSESETSVAVELMFAIITELYTLSSAWNIRRTLLQAAKTFLLRPGNPQLVTIKDLLQTSLLDANISDAGMAGHIYKLRENALPTEAELEAWNRDYPEKTEEQKEELRVKARKLLVTKGMPTALQSVMGAAASGEALGKVFDCLQVPEVSRGLVFGLMLQALRVVTH